MIIAQLSDLHARPRGRTAYGGVDTNAMLGRAIASVRTLSVRPDCVVITGDLADCGLDDEYLVLREELASLDVPVYLMPGNHDRREALLRAFADGHRYLPRDSDFLQYTIDEHPLRIIAIDSVVAGATHGELCARRLAWIRARLAERPGQPTIVFIHHPPFPTGIGSMDVHGCRAGSAELATIVAQHPNVERVVAGHYHRPITVRWAGTIGYAAPSTAHQVALDLRAGAPTRFVLEPPALSLHVWSETTGVVTHLQPIGDYGAWFDVTLEADYPGSRDARATPPR